MADGFGQPNPIMMVGLLSGVPVEYGKGGGTLGTKSQTEMLVLPGKLMSYSKEVIFPCLNVHLVT